MDKSGSWSQTWKYVLPWPAAGSGATPGLVRHKGREGKMRTIRLRVSVLATALPALAISIVPMLAQEGPAWGQRRNGSFPLIETFKNAAPDNPRWILGGFNNSSGPDPAFLTSGNADPGGNGWLRMTQLENQPVFLANSYAYYDVPFALGPGLLVSFDFASWGGSGADGISFYLFDGSTRNFVPGVGAGGLEYAPGRGLYHAGTLERLRRHRLRRFRQFLRVGLHRGLGRSPELDCHPRVGQRC